MDDLKPDLAEQDEQAEKSSNSKSIKQEDSMSNIDKDYLRVESLENENKKLQQQKLSQQKGTPLFVNMMAPSPLRKKAASTVSGVFKDQAEQAKDIQNQMTDPYFDKE